jgi:hypothetical protein
MSAAHTLASIGDAGPAKARGSRFLSSARMPQGEEYRADTTASDNTKGGAQS